MPSLRKILGQVQGTTGGDTIYTVPATARDAVISVLTVCNRTGGSITYRVAVIPHTDLTAPLNEHFIRYDVPLGANATDRVLQGVTLGIGDRVWVRASALTSLSFSLFGQENTY
jgi:hypothetical protein